MGTQSSYRGSAAAGSGLRPPQGGNLSPGDSLELGQKPKGLCGQGRDKLWGAPPCVPVPMGSGEQSTEEHPSCSPLNLLPTGGAREG